MEVNGTNLLLKYRRAIMGVAALLVYVGHVWEPMFGNVIGISFIEYFVKMTGFVGVDFFFFLSGMGLVYGIQKHKLSVFYLRRIKRTYFPFFLTAIAMLIVNRWTFDVFIGNVTGVHFLFENIYSLLWFVPAIMILYFLFPLYYKCFDKTENKYHFTALVMVVWLILSVLMENVLREDLYGFTNRIPIFILGVLTGWMIQNQKMSYTKCTWTLCVCVWMLGILFAFKTNFQGYFLLVPTSNCCVPNLLLATSGSFLLAKTFSFIDVQMGSFGRLVCRLFEFFGMVSLEFYCVQEWIGGLVLNKLRGHHRLITINAAVFVGVLVATSLLYMICKFFEKMFWKEREAFSAEIETA